jgi:dihydrofolate reductase
VRTLFAHIGVSLDGFISDGAGQPVLPVEEEFQHYIDELLSSIDGMVLGRKAFESLGAYWPSAGDEVSPIQARYMHELPKYVLSTSAGFAGKWHNSQPLGEDPISGLQSLKAEDGRPVAVFAGAAAVTSVLSFGLLDELRLIVHPSLVGAETRLFYATYPQTDLHLNDVRQFPSGTVLLSYSVVGSR